MSPERQAERRRLFGVNGTRLAGRLEKLLNAALEDVALVLEAEALPKLLRQELDPTREPLVVPRDQMVNLLLGGLQLGFALNGPRPPLELAALLEKIVVGAGHAATVGDPAAAG